MNEHLYKLSAERGSDLEVPNTMAAANIFSNDDAINSKFLFVTRFSRVPNWISLDGIDCKKVNE